MTLLLISRVIFALEPPGMPRAAERLSIRVQASEPPLPLPVGRASWAVNVAPVDWPWGVVQLSRSPEARARPLARVTACDRTRTRAELWMRM